MKIRKGTDERLGFGQRILGSSERQREREIGVWCGRFGERVKNVRVRVRVRVRHSSFCFALLSQCHVFVRDDGWGLASLEIDSITQLPLLLFRGPQLPPLTYFPNLICYFNFGKKSCRVLLTVNIILNNLDIFRISNFIIN